MTPGARIFFLLGSGLYLAMGTIHVLLVLWDLPRARLFVPVDKRLERAMRDTSLSMSRRLSVLTTFRGLNLSHGIGVLAFGLLGFLLGLGGFGDLAPGLVLAIALAFSLANLTIALRFWFGFPALGYGAATILFAVAGSIHLL